MKLAFVYAGQGSQKVGMGQDFYEAYPEFAKVIDTAAETVKKVTDFDLKKLSFEGPAETLNQTRYTQPCMVAYACGITKLLADKGIIPEYVFGLSLGEYSALHAAQVLDLETVIDLVAFRGKVMEEAVTGKEVKMSAVLMMDREVIEASCREAREQLAGMENGVVEVANYNCPGQIVISGDAQAVDLASEILKEKGAKRIIPLAVSGPFHTSLMKPAGDALKQKFQSVIFPEPKAEVIYNVTGKTMEAGESTPQLLERQVQSSVRLEDSIKFAESMGVDTIVEIGPGNTISKFIQKTTKNIKVYSIDNIESFESAVGAIGSEASN